MTEHEGKMILGVAAHVDAGKTTLCEQILLHTGVIRKAGRVDHGDSFLDDNILERRRGITIFSGQASFELDKGGRRAQVTLIDTPGHVDFSGETERVMSVLDAALLVVSCAEGVQSHTVTLFRMMRERKLPVMIFLNKTDRPGTDLNAGMAQIRRLLSPDCLLMTGDRDAVCEELAARDEELMELHFAGGAGREEYIGGMRRAFYSGSLIPVLPGSALEGTGIEELLELAALLTREDGKEADSRPFSAKVYRILHREGMRLSCVRILSGTLFPKDTIGTLAGPQKVNAFYRMQGGKLLPMDCARSGETAVLAGIEASAGEILGEGGSLEKQTLVPMMSVRVLPVPPTELRALLAHLRELEEEEPLLRVQPDGDGVSVCMMGMVQEEILKSLLEERFGDKITLTPPRVLYRETIASETVGIGHYEPLRHYAEVWLRLTPAQRGSGITFDSSCSVNDLELNWQRLIRTHVFEREHPGVLTGSPLTDVRIELIAGRAHLKHTEGGDFREAVYRAIRNGLMQAQCILLEPSVRFELAFPQECLSRVMAELLQMGAETDGPEYDGDEIRMCGVCRTAKFWDYPSRFASSTRGCGRIASRFDRYIPCPEQGQIIEESGYRAEADMQNPVGSVFCSHGAGFYVSWDHVREWAHCEPEILQKG